MIAAAVWIVLLTASLLVYPRRPRTAGTLLVLLACWTLSIRFMTWGNGRASSGLWGATWVAIVWLVVGLFWIVKFSNASRRAEHIGYWTEKA